MLLYITDISKKHQKSILDYTQNYLTELIPPHFVKLHIVTKVEKLFTSAKSISTNHVLPHNHLHK